MSWVRMSWQKMQLIMQSFNILSNQGLLLQWALTLENFWGLKDLQSFWNPSSFRWLFFNPSKQTTYVCVGYMGLGYLHRPYTRSIPIYWTEDDEGWGSRKPGESTVLG
jgi:hypothetical protein